MSEDLNQFIRDQVEIFKQNIPLFDELKNVIVATLERAAQTLPGMAIVRGRVKGIASFAEKCILKRPKYRKPALQLTDLCGVRVMVLSKDVIPLFQQFIEESFEVSENEDAAKRLKDVEFGYLSYHYIVSLKEDLRHLYHAPGGTISMELFHHRSGEEADKTGLPIGPAFKAEVQIRTMLQHAWSESIHDNFYKAEIKKMPLHLKRESARIAALLDDADDAFVRLIKGVHDYSSYYGAYMTREEIEKEISIQRTILACNPGDKAVALRIARLVDNLNDHGQAPKVVKDLSPFESLDDPDINRELGVARWRAGEKENGQASLMKATGRKPKDPDTWCELGRTYFEERQYWEALQAYEEAFKAAPEYPRALLRYIECRVLYDGDLSFIPLIRHNLEKAIEASRLKIAAGMHLPWAWYDIGFFQLLLDKGYESLEAYAKGILATSSPALIETIYGSLTEIHKKASHQRNEKLAEALRWVRSFFKVVLAGRFRKSADVHLCKGDPRLDLFSALAPSVRDSRPNPFTPGKEVVIVAGACGPSSESLVSYYAPIVQAAFSGFEGVVCSGGTACGISRIMGDLDDSSGAIRRIAYLPSGDAVTDMEHAAYEKVRTTKGDFSPMDPLMLWGDLLMSGISPEEVRILGISGGDISAFEYRLGLLLGARVGVLHDSGGASLSIALDPEWCEVKRVTAGSSRGERDARSPAGMGQEAEYGQTSLLRLPTDRESVRVFVQPPRPSKAIDPADRDRMAAAIHEMYRKGQESSALSAHKELAPWEALDPTFKESNLAVVDHIEDKLRSLGLVLKRVPDGEPVLYRFSDSQVETLAEKEHARWVVERLADGWVFGKVRDNEKKLRPQLIPWADLENAEKEKDRSSVREIPAALARQGYEIR